MPADKAGKAHSTVLWMCSRIYKCKQSKMFGSTSKGNARTHLCNPKNLARGDDIIVLGQSQVEAQPYPPMLAGADCKHLPQPIHAQAPHDFRLPKIT
eukprot:2589924-Pleurochrysis_carterae.AAC.1